MTTSQPWLSSQTASATIVADDKTTAPVARTRSTSSGAGKPKWKLTTSGRHRSTTLQASSSKGCLGDPGDICARSTPNCASNCESDSDHASSCALETSGGTWQKKLTLSGASVALRNSSICPESCSLVNIAAGSEPRPPAWATAMASATPLEPAIGACTMGNSIPSRTLSPLPMNTPAHYAAT